MYIISIDRIGQVFSSLSGENAEDYMEICLAAGQSIGTRLRKGINIAKREPELIYAAACLAFYRYCLAEQSEGVSSYKAGDINVTNSPQHGIAAARELLHDAMKSISDCLKSNDFCFKSI